MACLETDLLVYIESMIMHPDSKGYVFFFNIVLRTILKI